MPHLGSVKSVILGLVVLWGLAAVVLSFRPGGLRAQLRLMARRFRLAMILTGAFLLASPVLALTLSGSNLRNGASAVLAALLAVLFLFLAQDPPVIS